MTFPHYQWVVSGFDICEFLATKTVFSYSGEFYNCSNNNFLKNNLILSYTLDSVDPGAPLVSGYTYHEVFQQYLYRVSSYNTSSTQKKALSISPSIWATITYDAVLDLVLAMNMSTVIFKTVIVYPKNYKRIKSCSFPSSLIPISRTVY